MPRTGGQRLYRWVGEFLLIVAGVITALAADGWNQDRSRAADGRAYVEQLNRETQDNLRILGEVLEYERIGLAAVEAVMNAGAAGAQIQQDSLRVLYLERHLFQSMPLHFVRGTLSTLTDLGGVNFVEDRNLQAAILDYSARIETGLSGYRELTTRQADHVYEISAMYQAATGFSDPMTLHQFLLGTLEPAVIAHLEHIRLARANKVWSLGQMIDATQSLSTLLSGDPE